MIYFVILLGLLPVLAFAAIFCAAKSHKPDEPEPEQIDPVIALLTDMLKIPQGWDRDEYHLWHKTGAKFWISNDEYGLAVSINGGKCSPRNSAGGGDFPITDKQAKHLWPHVERNLNADKAAALNERVIAFAERAREHADNVVQLRVQK